MVLCGLRQFLVSGMQGQSDIEVNICILPEVIRGYAVTFSEHVSKV